MANDTSTDINTLTYLQAAYTQEYQAVLEAITSQLAATESIAKSREFLEHLPELYGKKTFAANGVLLYDTTIDKSEKVAVYVGAGYFVEKGIDEAKAFLDTLAKENDETLKRLYEEKQLIEKELTKIGYQIAKLQKG